VILRQFAVSGTALALDEALGVILTLAEFPGCTPLDDAFGPCNLFLTCVPEIVSVLERECDNEPLLKFSYMFEKAIGSVKYRDVKIVG